MMTDTPYTKRLRAREGASFLLTIEEGSASRSHIRLSCQAARAPVAQAETVLALALAEMALARAQAGMAPAQSGTGRGGTDLN